VNLPFGTGAAPFAALLCLWVSACSPAYVLRAGYEEAKILWRRQPIEEMLQEPNLDPETRAKLELVLAARAFAGEMLRLRVGGSYTSFARVDADQVVHVVTAAYRDRLVPYTWWFPIVGRVPYKGYFSADAAAAEAAALQERGLDTSVGSSIAFSTLGWFDDPLLSTVLRFDQVSLANTVIHELLHNTAYLAGQAAFDESFATFVGSRGAILFFAGRGDETRRQRAQADWEAALVFSDFMGRFTARLRDAYASGISLEARAQLFAQAQDECRTLALHGRYRSFIEEPLNNAVILHTLMYSDRLRLFEALWQRCGGDLPRTIARVLDAVGGAPADPFGALDRLLAAPADGRAEGASRAGDRAAAAPPRTDHISMLRSRRTP
jgi:predicted aminopeptidase